MSPVTLHYLHDPLCGWCYAVAPLLQAARALLPVRAHAGGLMAGERRQPVTAALRAFVLPHDDRIAQLSGQPFGAAYRDGLLVREGAVFDSEPPIAAVLAAEQLAGRGLDLLARLQTAHYVEGRELADAAVLVALAAELGLPAERFAPALAAARRDAVAPHLAATRALMARVGAQGFPHFVLEQDGALHTLPWRAHLGRPEAFLRALRERLAGLAGPVEPAPAGPAAAPACGPAGCAL